MENDEKSLDDRTYSVAETASKLGVAPATLRTWARRHGMEPSQHLIGAHRRYTKSDLAKLMIMRTQVLRGTSTQEAARHAIALVEEGVDFDQVEHELVRELQSRSGSHPGDGAEVSRQSHAPNVRLLEDARPHRFTISDAHSQPPAPATPQWAPRPALPNEILDYKDRCTELVLCALRDDEERSAQLIELNPNEPVIEWWKLFIRPALDRLSAHTVLANPGVSPKLMVGYLAGRALKQRIALTRPDVASQERPHPSRLRKIVLVFAPEQDDLATPAHVLVTALLESNCNAHVIFGPGNLHRMSELVRMVRPAAVAFVSNQVSPQLDVLLELSRQIPELPVYVGLREGLTVEQRSALPQVTFISSFRALFHEILIAVQSADPSAQYWKEDDDSDGPVRLKSIT